MTATEKRVFTQADIDAIEALDLSNTQTAFNENAVKRDRETGRIIDGPDGPMDKNTVEFTTEPMYSKVLTYLHGSTQYEDVDFITITCPGKAMLFNIHRPVTDLDIFNYPVEYKNFKENSRKANIGTPLRLWPAIGPSETKMYELSGYYTVEQVASGSDTVPGILNTIQLRQKAQDYLDLAKDVAKQEQLRAQVEALTSQRDVEVETLKKQVEQLLSINKAQQESKTPRKT